MCNAASEVDILPVVSKEHHPCAHRLTAVVTFDIIFMPEVTTTVEPSSWHSATCPPVTLVYVVVFNSVGKKAGVAVTADA